jgi:hypothetical protein
LLNRRIAVSHDNTVPEIFNFYKKSVKKIKLWEKDLAADAKDATLNKNLVLKTN